MTAQFATVIAKGGRYLQTGGKTAALSLVVLAYSISKHPDPMVAAKWRHYAFSLAVLLFFIPFEKYAIFPLNDKIEEIRMLLEAKDGQDVNEKTQIELRILLKKWQARNLIRALLTLVSALICFFDVISS